MPSFAPQIALTEASAVTTAEVGVVNVSNVLNSQAVS
jgi:hypothetical protein